MGVLYSYTSKPQEALGDSHTQEPINISFPPAIILIIAEAITQKQWFSKCGWGLSIISSIWELVRNAHSRPHTRPNESDALVVDTNHLCFNKPSRVFCYMLKFEKHCKKGSWFSSSTVHHQ